MSASLKLQNPKVRRPPSERDQEIYRLCKAQRVPQKELAPQFGIKPPRVSQIVKEVGQWLANAGVRDGELDHHQERRLERRIERARLEHLYGYNLRMLADFEKPAESTRGEGEGAVKTTREERNARVQALKSAIRTAESLGKIAEREPLPPPPSEEKYIHPARLYAELKHQREEAEERTAVPVSGNSHELVSSLLAVLVGRQIYPLPVPGSPLAAALRKIAEVLAAAAGAGGQHERGRESIAATAPADGEPLPQLTEGLLAANLPCDAPGAKVTKLAGYSLLDGCDPEILQNIIASGWLERFKDGGEMHRESLVAASLARENSGEFSAATESVAGERGRESIAAPALADGQRLPQLTPDPLQAAPAKPAESPRGIDVVGSPEWKVARAQWFKERDQRVERERLQKIQERLEREEEQRQRRSAADARRRWLEAGRCQY